MIYMECLSPKRAQGECELATYEDLVLWVIANIRGGKTKVGSMLRTLAEKGELTTANIGYDIHVTSDFFIQDYFELDELKRQSGLIKKRGFGDYRSIDPKMALNFAKELDKRANLQEVLS